MLKGTKCHKTRNGCSAKTIRAAYGVSKMGRLALLGTVNVTPSIRVARGNQFGNRSVYGQGQDAIKLMTTHLKS